MKKASISVLLIVVPILFSACSANGKGLAAFATNGVTDPTEAATQTAEEATTEAITEATTEAVTEETTEAPTEAVTATEAASANDERADIIEAGDVIKGKQYEVTIISVRFSYDVLPDKTGIIHLISERGMVYIDIDADVKNTAKQKLCCGEVMTVTADYNGGYLYEAYPVVEDSTTGFAYASTSYIVPLGTKGMRYLIDCPEEVSQSDQPLFLIFNIGGKDYKYIVR